MRLQLNTYPCGFRVCGTLLARFHEDVQVPYQMYGMDLADRHEGSIPSVPTPSLYPFPKPQRMKTGGREDKQ